MKIIQIIGVTGSGKSHLGKCIPGATIVDHAGTLPISFNQLSGVVVVDNYRSTMRSRLNQFLKNDKVTHLYILSERYINKLTVDFSKNK